MSKVTSFRESFALLREEWKALDRTIRFLDLVSIGLILLFGVTFILVNVMGIPLIVSNAAMMIFPLLLSGYIYNLRSELTDDSKNNAEAKKQFTFLVGVTLGLILLTFVYSILLNQVLL